MKLKSLILTLFLVLSSVTAYAATELLPATSSGAVTFAVNPDTQVYTGACQLTGISLFTDGTNAATVTIYDGTADTDKKVWYTYVIGADRVGGRIFVPGIGINTGLYVEVTGTGAWYIIEYIK